MKCNYIKEDGKACNAYSVNNSNYCFSHDPKLTEQKAIAVKKGGLSPKRLYLNNKEAVNLNSANEVKDFLGILINEVWLGNIPAAQPANTLGFLVRVFLDTLDKVDFEERICNLEKKLEKI